LVGLSAAGALANNGAQLVLGKWLLFGEGVRFVAPVLFATGTVTGVLLGVFAEQFAARSAWVAAMRGETAEVTLGESEVPVGAAEVPVGTTEVPVAAGKFRVAPVVAVTLGVTFFALLVPAGKVLAHLGPLAVTEGALLAGLRRSAVLVGTVVVSRVVLRALKGRKTLPLLSAIFLYYNKIVSQKVTWSKGSVLVTLDALLLRALKV
jgi:heptaprenyl diphosphate synthase